MCVCVCVCVARARAKSFYCLPFLEEPHRNLFTASREATRDGLPLHKQTISASDKGGRENIGGEDTFASYGLKVLATAFINALLLIVDLVLFVDNNTLLVNFKLYTL